MLFDLKLDPGENINVVDHEEYRPTVSLLSERLRQIVERRH